MNYYDEDCEYSSIVENFQENNIPSICNIGNLDPEFVNVCTDGYRGGPNGEEKEINDCINTYGNEDCYVYMCMYGSTHRSNDKIMKVINASRG